MGGTRTPPELSDDPLLFLCLGRPRLDGAFPDAGGKLSGPPLLQKDATQVGELRCPARSCAASSRG